MRACWLKWVGRDWSISADYIWLNYSGANTQTAIGGVTTLYIRLSNMPASTAVGIAIVRAVSGPAPIVIAKAVPKTEPTITLGGTAAPTCQTPINASSSWKPTITPVGISPKKIPTIAPRTIGRSTIAVPSK